MESQDKIKILSILPVKMGNDFVNKIISMNMDSHESTKVLGEMLEQNIVEVNPENIFVLTEKGKEFLSKGEDERREDLSNLNLKDNTKKALENIVWDSKKRRIHPAQDFDSNLAYTICYLTRKTKVVEEKIEKVVEQETPFIITSERDLISVNELPEDILLLDQPRLPKGNDFLIRESNLTKFPSQNIIKKFLDGKGNVTFKEVFDDVKERFKHFMDFDEPRYYAFCTVWAIGTYFFQLFSSYPYMFLNALKASGKSKTIKILAYCSFCPEIVVSPSVASLFRLIQVERCSFFLDEVEALSTAKENPEIRTLLLSGYKRGAGISRTKETENKKLKSFESVTFDIFCPKAMGNIRGLENIMESRCVTLSLKKTVDVSIGNRQPEDGKEHPKFQVIRDKLFLNQMLNWKQVRKNHSLLSELVGEDGKTEGFDAEDVKNIKENLIGRSWELWQPLLSIALCISQETFKEILSLAVDMTNIRTQDEVAENYESTAVRVLCQLVNETNWYATSDLSRELANYEGLERLTSRSLTAMLRRIGLKSPKMPNKKINNKHYVFIDLNTLKSCASRMDMNYDQIRAEELSIEQLPKKEKLLNLLRELDGNYGDGIPRYEIVNSGRLIYDEDKMNEMLEKFQTEGIIYCPRPNVFSFTKSEKQAKLSEIDGENIEIGDESEDLGDEPK